MDTLQEMNEKMRTLETTKKYKYNTKKGKTEWMMIRNNRRKEEAEPELEVSSGKIGRTRDYKYVGDKYDERGTNESKIKFKDNKVNLMVNDIKAETTEKKLGKAALKTRIMLIETIITPTILSSTETWHNITQNEQNMIRNIHRNILTKTFNLPITTPYMGIISELNIIPYVEMIWFKKFMWFHRLINSNEDRMARIKLMEQIKENDDNWYTEVRDYAEQNEIAIDETIIRSTTYPRYKEHVAKRIRQKVKIDLEHEKEKRTKLRYIEPRKLQDYFNVCAISEASMIMKIRLHMICAKGNFGGGKCRECHEEEETTEHVISCQTGKNIEFDKEKVSDISWLRGASKVYAFFEEQYKNN